MLRLGFLPCYRFPGVFMRSFILAAAMMPVLTAQMPAQPDETFFKGDAAQIMVSCAERAASIKPRDQHVLAQVGRIHLLARDLPKAESYFSRALSGDGEAYRWMGQAWLESGETEKGLNALMQVPQRDWRAKNTQRDAAVLLMDAGFPKEAESVMKAAFAVDKYDWQNVTAFGRACLRQRRPDLAADWFSLIMANRRKEEGLWNEIALAFADQGEER
jgi:tetratricopeptide (TPR) repeat protein